MGHKFFRIKLKGSPEEAHPFGEVVTLPGAWFVTMHTNTRAYRRCSYCDRKIERSTPYVRFHTPRCEETGGHPATDRRCMKCIEAGNLPEDIEYLNTFESFDHQKTERK